MFNKYYFIGFLFALLSSLRVPFLPELQLVLILALLLIYGKVNRNLFFLIITILCTHHYAIPDAIYRFQGELYPSIYTRAYFGIKLLDILIVFLFIFSLRNLNNLKFILNKNLPFLLLPISFFGVIYLNSQTFSFDMFLFIFRSYLLIIGIYLITYSFSREDLIFISKLAIFSWTVKMFFAILIPHEAPLYREIFGFQGIIFFAGDEYLTIGSFLMIILLLVKRNELKFIPIFILLNFIFLLTLIAQRKGGVTYFIILNIILFIYFYIKNSTVHKLFNFLMVINIFLGFLFLYLVVPLLPEDVQLGFLEYSALSSSALDSIANINIYNQIFGITPFGKYELINLNSIFDHSMSFGKEVGEMYRYQLWTIPMGRLILNVGIIGYLYYLAYIVIRASRENIVSFYLLSSIMGFFYFSLITPVSAIAIGISLSAFIRYKKRNLLENNI